MDWTALADCFSALPMITIEAVDFFWSIANTIVKDVSNPDGYTTRLVSPLFAACFGAFFGVFFAAKFTHRSEEKKYKLEELRSLLKTASLSAQVCNSAISLKRQHVKSLVDTFLSNRNQVLRELGIPTSKKNTILLNLDMQTISIFQAATCDLFKQVNKEILLPEVQAQVSAAFASSENIERLISNRNAWISEFRSKDLTEHEVMILYFGIPDGKGTLDTTYFDLVTNLGDCTNDLIFHSYMINYRVSKVLLQKMENYRVTYKNAPFSIPFFGLNAQEKAELLPDFKNYSEWMVESVEIKKPFYRSWRRHYSELRKHIALPTKDNWQA